MCWILFARGNHVHHVDYPCHILARLLMGAGNTGSLRWAGWHAWRVPSQIATRRRPESLFHGLHDGDAGRCGSTWEICFASQDGRALRRARRWSFAETHAETHSFPETRGEVAARTTRRELGGWEKRGSREFGGAGPLRSTPR